MLETPEANLVSGMKWLQGTYTQRFNATFRCRGHLFQSRYKAIPIEALEEPSYFRRVSRYIHLNPFRAGICGEGKEDSLQSYRWSSYPAYIGAVKKRPEWLERKRVLLAHDLIEGKRGALRGYRTIMESIMLWRTDLDSAEERDAEHQSMQRKWFYGSEEFKEQLMDRLGTSGGDNLRGDLRRDHSSLEAERLLVACLVQWGLDEESFLKLASNSLNKQAAAWLFKRRTTVTAVWIADRLLMEHRSNVSRAITRFNRAKPRNLKS